jgi:hypothetical protein
VGFALLVVGTITCLLIKARGLGYSADDWNLFRRGGSLRDFFEPYNDSLSVVPIAVYRAILFVFGLGTPLPLRLVSVLSSAAIAVAVFLVVRARVGIAPAVVAGSVLLWYPNFALLPQAFDHYFALTAVVVCAGLLPKDGTAVDVSLAVALTFALCNSGIGVAGGVGALTYVALARAPGWRWASVLVPMAAWFAWWVAFAKHGSTPGVSTSTRIDYVVDGIAASFRGLVFDSAVLAVVLAAAFVLTLGWRLRRGVLACCSELAWTVALAAWWIGLAYSRGGFTSADTVRYDLAGSVFVVLAFLPTRPTTWRLPDRRVAFSAVVGFAALVVVVNSGDIFRNQRVVNEAYKDVRVSLTVGNLSPAVVPDHVLLNVGGFARMTAGQYRRLVAQHGEPAGTSPEHVDASVLAVAGVRPEATRTIPSGRCVELTRSSPVPSASMVTLRAGASDVRLRLRRFDRGATDAGTIRAGSSATLRLPGPPGARPWILDAPGACRLVDVHPGG